MSAPISVRAKFFCAAKTEAASSPGGVKSSNVVLHPIVNGSEENKMFFQHTPGGRMELNLVNPGTAKKIEVGKEYYIDITPAE